MFPAAFLAQPGASASVALAHVASHIGGQPPIDGTALPFELPPTWGVDQKRVAAVISVLVTGGQQVVMGGAVRDLVLAFQGHGGSLPKDVDCYSNAARSQAADASKDPGARSLFPFKKKPNKPKHIRVDLPCYLV